MIDKSKGYSNIQVTRVENKKDNTIIFKYAYEAGDDPRVIVSREIAEVGMDCNIYMIGKNHIQVGTHMTQIVDQDSRDYLVEIMP